ncbi:hypothetical protein RCL1_003088 [Eukaryota sp. TZLM3-RCL]
MKGFASSEVVLVSAGIDNTICTWSLPSLARQRSFACAKQQPGAVLGPIGCLDLSHDGRYIAAGVSSQAKLFDRNAPPGNVDPVHVFREGTHTGPINTIGHLRSTRITLFTASDDCSAAIWDMSQRKPAIKTTLPTMIYHGVPISRDRISRAIIFGCEDGIYHWSLDTETVIKGPSLKALPCTFNDLPPLRPPSCTKLAVCSRTNVVASGLSDGRVALYKTSNISTDLPTQWSQPFYISTPCSFIVTVNLSPFPRTPYTENSCLLTVGGTNGILSSYKVVCNETEEVDGSVDSVFTIEPLFEHRPAASFDPILDSVMSSDGEHLFTATMDGKVNWFRFVNDFGTVDPFLYHDKTRHSEVDTKPVCCLALREVVGS